MPFELDGNPLNWNYKLGLQLPCLAEIQTL